MTLGNGALDAWVRDLAGAANEKDFQSHLETSVSDRRDLGSPS